MNHVFISYNKKHNREYARKLADKLLVLGFDVWIDDLIDYGDEWWPTITKAIRDCKAFVPIMTPASDVSEWVRREVHLANQLPRPIFPILLAGDLIDCDFWTMFLGKQYADVRDGSLPKDDYYARLEREAPRRETRGVEINVPATPPPTPPRIQGGAQTLARVEGILPPPFEWVEIPAGKVTLEKGGYLEEETTFEVPAFAIAKYPVTNAQFAKFIEAGGYKHKEWWTKAGLQRKQEQRWESPRFWHDRQWNGINFPVVGVSWFEAMAFCMWLTQYSRSRMQITLPTEQQWQRAAQGDDGRRYPWGNDFGENMCNTSESGIQHTTQVMQYPQGASPYGVLDMSGNVLETCLTNWKTGDIDSDSGAQSRVIRGGSFKNILRYAACTYRSQSSPTRDKNNYSFRMVAALSMT